MLAAAIKLIIPIIIVFPGIMAAHLYPEKIGLADQAYPVLIREVLPAGLTGIMFAALFGAVMSSLDSLLNSAATIFTMDVYKRHLRPRATSADLIGVGRIATAALVIVGCLWAPVVARAGSVFDYIQMFWGFISPGIVAVFVLGLLWRRVPPVAAVGAMVLGVPVYGALLGAFPDVAFLHHMAITFLVLVVYMTVVTLIRPMAEAPSMPVRTEIDLKSSSTIKWAGAAVLLATAALYAVFW
jgi:SSS family solute:Na+ symporter